MHPSLIALHEGVECKGGCDMSYHNSTESGDIQDGIRIQNQEVNTKGMLELNGF